MNNEKPGISPGTTRIGWVGTGVMGLPMCGPAHQDVHQIVIAGSMIGVCESLVYATNAGLDPSRVLESVTRGAASSWALENLAPPVIARESSSAAISKRNRELKWVPD